MERREYISSVLVAACVLVAAESLALERVETAPEAGAEATIIAHERRALDRWSQGDPLV